MAKSLVKMRSVLVLLGVFFVYSCSGIFTKLAGGYTFLSMPYIGLVAAAVGVLGLYAVLWQKVLERAELSRAYLFKSMTLVYSIIFSAIIFHEAITVANIIGILIIISGIMLISWDRR